VRDAGCPPVVSSVPPAVVDRRLDQVRRTRQVARGGQQGAGAVVAAEGQLSRWAVLHLGRTLRERDLRGQQHGCAEWVVLLAPSDG
jgi:hypothetical protein